MVCNWSTNGYRLPTEAEWEKAARGGLSGKRFPWGDTITHSQANYYSDASFSYDVSPTRGYHPTYAVNGYPYTSPVGSFAANGYGLYDMAGNVSEWCWDWYGTYAAGAQTDPRGASSGSDRVSRGCSWGSFAKVCRVADHGYYYPHGSVNDLGFRVARSSVPPFLASVNNITVDTRSVILTLAASPVGQGGIAGAGGYAKNAAATVTATAAPGYVFSGWTGAATGSVNPLSVMMDADKTITANFIPDTNDTDSDGLNNYNEVVIYGTNPALSDTDGDGLKDGSEVGVGRFSIIAGSFTWAQARADAHARSGELACFPTTDRWNRAMDALGANAFDSYTGLWIGASDAATDGIWTWVNGETFTFTNWGTSRPSTTPGNTLDYAEVSGGAGSEIGKWYDRSAVTVRDGYILEMGYATNPLVADTDGDGYQDGAEAACGSNPLAAASVPEYKMSHVLNQTAGTIQLSFPAQQGMTYTVQESTDLVHWTAIETGISGQGAVITRTYPMLNLPKRYLRVGRN